MMMKHKKLFALVGVLLLVITASTTVGAYEGHLVDVKAHLTLDPAYICEFGGPTRTIGFWGAHLAATTQVFDSLGSIDLGWRNITSIEEVMGIFWANTARDSDNEKRSELCQSKIKCASQALAAVLNTAVGGKPLPVALADIQAILNGTDKAAIDGLHSLLDDYNNSGDDVPLGIPEGSATPAAAKALADIEFADCP